MLRSGSTGPAFERISILTETIDVNIAQRIYALSIDAKELNRR